MSDNLKFTGERFLPDASGEIWYEHWHRYHFASQLVAGCEVLDVACGEGYGSALLARHAQHVIGADIATETIKHAQAAYAPMLNLEFRQADCSALPFPDASFDAVVSFETIEHIDAQAKFLDEVQRVLRPDGLFVLSSPNKVEYSDRSGFANPYHVRELDREGLAALLGPRFPYTTWFGQRVSFFSVVWAERRASEGEIFELSQATPADASPGHARPLYFIVIACRNPETLAAAAPRLSVLADRDEWVYRDYAKVFANQKIQWERGNALDGVVAQWQEHSREAVRQRDALQSTLTAQTAEYAAERARLTGQIDAQQQEIDRREGLGWWLALPWRRLRSTFRRVLRAA